MPLFNSNGDLIDPTPVPAEAPVASPLSAEETLSPEQANQLDPEAKQQEAALSESIPSVSEKSGSAEPESEATEPGVVGEGGS